jgi:hypothetical protein
LGEIKVFLVVYVYFHIFIQKLLYRGFLSKDVTKYYLDDALVNPRNVCLSVFFNKIKDSILRENFVALQVKLNIKPKVAVHEPNNRIEKQHRHILVYIFLSGLGLND